MLTVESAPDHVIAVRFTDVLEKADVEVFKRIVDEKLQANTRLGLLLDMSQWSDVSAEAMLNKTWLDLASLEKLRRFGRIAFVSDKQFVWTLAGTLNALVGTTEIMSYAAANHAQGLTSFPIAATRSTAAAQARAHRYGRSRGARFQRNRHCRCRRRQTPAPGPGRGDATGRPDRHAGRCDGLGRLRSCLAGHAWVGRNEARGDQEGPPLRHRRCEAGRGSLPALSQSSCRWRFATLTPANSQTPCVGCSRETACLCQSRRGQGAGFRVQDRDVLWPRAVGSPAFEQVFAGGQHPSAARLAG